jgi:hypothetical protein
LKFWNDLSYFQALGPLFVEMYHISLPGLPKTGSTGPSRYGCSLPSVKRSVAQCSCRERFIPPASSLVIDNTATFSRRSAVLGASLLIAPLLIAPFDDKALAAAAVVGSSPNSSETSSESSRVFVTAERDPNTTITHKVQWRAPTHAMQCMLGDFQQGAN